MGYQIVFSYDALRDLRNIKQYISLDFSQIAKRFGQQLIQKQIYWGPILK